MKLQRKNKYSKRVAIGLSVIIIGSSLFSGCGEVIDTKPPEIVEVMPTEESVSKKFYDISTEEKKLRMNELEMKYPNAKWIIGQVTTVVIKNSSDKYKVIQTFNRKDVDNKIAHIYDLFTEEFLFDLPYESEEDFIFDTNTSEYSDIDLSRITNAIPYFDDKKIVEYGASIYSTLFVQNHIDEISSNPDYLLSGNEMNLLWNYLYPNSFNTLKTSFTTEQLGDNYVTTVPNEFRVTAEEMGIKPTYHEENKYSDYWKISEEEIQNRLNDLVITNPEEIRSMEICQTLMLKDQNDTYKIINIRSVINEEGLKIYDLYSDEWLLTFGGIKNSSLFLDLITSGDYSRMITDCVPYFKNKTIFDIGGIMASNSFVNDHIDEFRKLDGINYIVPDSGCTGYLYPLGDYMTSEYSYSILEYAIDYVVTVPKEFQVPTSELLMGIEKTNEEEKVLVK